MKYDIYGMSEEYDDVCDMLSDEYDNSNMSSEEEEKKVVIPLKKKIKTQEDIENELKEVEKFKEKVSPFLKWANISSTAVASIDHDDSKFPKLGQKIDKSWVEVKTKKKIIKKEEKGMGNTRTKMCSYAKCPHGVNCRFAHSIKELNILNCMFDDCKLVRMVDNDKYVNTHKNKRCERRHKNESDVNFFIRTGIKDPITEEEIKVAYDVFINSYDLLTSEMHMIIEKCPCDKMVSFFGVSYCGKSSPSEPVKQKYVKYKEYKKIKQKEIKCKEIKTKKVNIASNVKFQKENPETVYIRKRNEKSDEIKSLKTIITRTQDTINRLKQQKNYSMIKKYEDEYKNKIEKLVVLEKEFTEIKIEKIIEIEEIPIEVEEKKVEKKVEKKKENMIILQIILPKKVEEVIEEKENDSSSDDSDTYSETGVETSIRNIIVPPSPNKVLLPSSTDDNGVGWISIENKKQVQKTTKSPSPKPVKKSINIPPNTFKSQMCRSLTTVPKTKCPHGDKCRYAHNINELLCNVKECGFGALCKLVGKDTIVGEYKNTGYKICSYKHPMESKNSYIRRNKY